MKNVVITTSWDDGHPLDLRLAKLLRRHGVPATFYIPIKNIERESIGSQEIRKIAEDFDIGGHTFHHVNLTTIPSETAEKEICECKNELERILDQEVVSFCYPYGAYDDKIVAMVKKAGFKGARTSRLFETRIKDPYQIGATVTMGGNNLLAYTRLARELILTENNRMGLFLVKNLLNKSIFNWFEVAIATLNFITFGGIWHLRGHSWEIEKYNYWERLEIVFEKIKEIKETENVSLLDNSQLILQFLNNDQNKVETMTGHSPKVS